MIKNEEINEVADKLLDSFYQQACVTTSDINEHLPILRRYAEDCTHVTEFGVRDVCSSWAFLAGRPSRMVSYDINRSAAVANLENVGKLVCEFSFIEGDVLTVDIEETDLLFIDTLHSYAQLTAELTRHAKMVRKWIILHDTTTFGDPGQDGKTPGLWRAVEEFCGNGAWSILERYHNNNGLTVLEHK